MKTAPDLSNLIGLIYEAALQTDGWPAVLDEIGALLGACWLVLSLLRARGGSELDIQDSNGDAGHFALFKAKFTSPDTNPAVRRLLTVRPGTVITPEQEMSDRQWRREPLYREIYRPIGLYHGAGALISRSASQLAPLAINRTRRRGPFTEHDFTLISNMLPHLRRALAVTSRMAAIQQAKSTYETLWDRLPYGVALLDGDGKLIWANHSVWSFLDESDGLALSGGRLCATHADNGALSRLIADTIAIAKGWIGDRREFVAVRRPSQRRPYAVLVAPVSMSATQFGRVPAVVVVVTDPERSSATQPSRLTELFGFTPREAALAALLMSGLGLDEIAAKLALSRNTVRQHLRSLFEKTGTHRQAELVHLLLRSPLGLF